MPNEPSEPPNVTPQVILDFMTSTGLIDRLTEAERLHFIHTACEYNLNPYRREIHCIPVSSSHNQRLTLVVGFETYIKRAEATAELDGWKSWVEGDGNDLRAGVEIYRKGWAHPFVHEAFWKESAPFGPDGSLPPFWVKQPRFQLRKVAVVQAFRLAFSIELGGLPYDPAELGLDLPNATQLQAATSQTSTRPAPAPPARGSTQASTPSAPSDRGALRSRIESLMASSPNDFNPKHRSWVLGRYDAAQTIEEAKRLLGYVEKVLRTSRQAPTKDPVF